MKSSGTDPIRQFQVRKDNGEAWFMNFTSQGVQWVKDNERDAAETLAGSTFSPRGPLPSSPLTTMSAVLEGAASIGMWWETRQLRLANEAANEENRRIAWLEEMLVRWGEVHREGDVLDLRVSEYLAREARATMGAISGNRRLALPQTLLYELELVRESLRPFRVLLLEQFEALVDQQQIGIAAALEAALPGRALDMNFLQKLGADPSIDRANSKTSGDFDLELEALLRQPDAFLARVLPGRDRAPTNEPSAERRGSVFETLISVLAPSVPKTSPIDGHSDAPDRADSFRELSTVPAEVARARGLHMAWTAVTTLFAAASGHDLEVRLDSKEVRFALEPAGSRLTLASLAVD